MNQRLYKCVFLDRDGIINHDPGDYTRRTEDFTILPGVTQMLKKWQERGYKLIVITNQGGIAKGLYTAADLEKVHAHLIESLAQEGVVLTDIFFSPGHPEIGASISRKPSGLMIQRGMALHNIDPNQSFMIGDRATDAQAASDAGIRCFILPINSSIERLTQMIQ